MRAVGGGVAVHLADGEDGLLPDVRRGVRARGLHEEGEGGLVIRLPEPERRLLADVRRVVAREDAAEDRDGEGRVVVEADGGDELFLDVRVVRLAVAPVEPGQAFFFLRTAEPEERTSAEVGLAFEGADPDVRGGVAAGPEAEEDR